MGLDLFSLLASLCEGGGPAGPEGESLAMTRNISGRRKVLSPTRCGGSPLPEGAKRGGHAPLWISTTHGWWDRRVSISSTGICIVPVRTVTSTWAAPFSGRD